MRNSTLPQRRPGDRILIGAGLAALAVTFAASYAAPPALPAHAAALALCALLVMASNLTPLRIREGHVSLTGLLAVSSLLMFGLTGALWVAMAGSALAGVIRAWRAGRAPAPRRMATMAGQAGVPALSLLGSWLAFSAAGGRAPLAPPSGALWPLSILFLSYFLINHLLDSVSSDRPTLWRNRQVMIFNLLALPLSLVVADVYAHLSLWSFAGLAAFLLAGMLGMHSLNQAQAAAERRVRELTSLEAIGQAMRSSLDLPELLETIHDQIGQLADADNFYVALYDPELNRISCPLMYENGARVQHGGQAFANGMAEWVIRSRRPCLIRDDVAGTLQRLGVDMTGPPAQSWLGVPMISEDQVIGVIALQHPTRRQAYDDSHLSLLTTIAAQAAIAIRNAQLYSTTHQRMTEMAILNSVSTALSASLDLEQVVRVIVASVSPVVGCDKAAFFLLDNDGAYLQLIGSKDLGQAYLEHARRIAVGPAERGVVAYTRTPLLVPDVYASPDLADLRPIADAEGFRALAEVPLMARSEVVGTLAVYYVQVHPFTQVELDLLITFANQAAVAVANARLYARTDQALARRVEEITVMEEIGRELLVTLNVERIIDRMLEQATEVTGAEYGVIVLFDAVLEEARLLAYRGYPPQLMAPLIDQPWPLQRGIVGRVLRSGQLANIPNVRADPDYYEAVPGVQSLLAVPIMHEERTMGVIALESKTPDAFDSQAVSFIAHLGNQAVIALTNARLYEEAQRRLREISILYEASQHFAGLLDLDLLANKIVEQLSQALNSTHCLLELGDWPTDTLQVIAHYSLEKAHRPSFAAPGAPGRASAHPALAHLRQTREPLVAYADDPRTDPEVQRWLAAARQHAALVLPLIVGDDIIGMVECLDDRPRRFSGDETRLAQTLANQAAISIEHSRLFRRIAEGRDRLQAILNASSAGILMFDLTRHIIMVNPMLESLWQVSRQALEGQRLEDLIRRPSLKIADKLGLQPAGAEPFEQLRRKIRDTYQLPAPSLRFVERTTTPVLDPADRLVGWLVTLRDVTDERELQQTRDDLTSMIVHDLRSPLGAILSGLLMIRDLVASTPEAAFALEVVQVSEHSTRKLLTLVDSLLDLSKGRLQLNVGPIQLQTLVKNVLDTLAPLAAENGIILSSQLPPGLPPVLIDEDKISRVVTNLLDNALKFTPAGRPVTLSAEVIPSEARSCVQVAVQDAGPGIPAEYIERIFDRFVQVPNQVGRRRGTGLGLAFCKLAVEAHGERIWVNSVEGQGSTFYFTLPIHEGHGAVSLTDATTSGASS